MCGAGCPRVVYPNPHVSLCRGADRDEVHHDPFAVDELVSAVEREVGCQLRQFAHFTDSVGVYGCTTAEMNSDAEEPDRLSEEVGYPTGLK